MSLRGGLRAYGVAHTGWGTNWNADGPKAREQAGTRRAQGQRAAQPSANMLTAGLTPEREQGGRLATR